jgi:hypothetical protein
MLTLMRTLTLSQRLALVKMAREYAKQNRSKPPKSEKNAKPFVGKAAAARMRSKDDVAKVTPTPIGPTPPHASCKKCGYSYRCDILKNHEKKCRNVPKPPPIVPKEVVYECPKCDLDMPVKERDQHLKAEHNLILCKTCSELVVDGIESHKHFLDHIVSSTAKNGASAPQGVRWDSSSYHRSWDGTDPIILGGGLCNGK